MRLPNGPLLNPFFYQGGVQRIHGKVRAGRRHFQGGVLAGHTQIGQALFRMPRHKRMPALVQFARQQCIQRCLGIQPKAGLAIMLIRPMTGIAIFRQNRANVPVKSYPRRQQVRYLRCRHVCGMRPLPLSHPQTSHNPRRPTVAPEKAAHRHKHNQPGHGIPYIVPPHQDHSAHGKITVTTLLPERYQPCCPLQRVQSVGPTLYNRFLILIITKTVASPLYCTAPPEFDHHAQAR